MKTIFHCNICCLVGHFTNLSQNAQHFIHVIPPIIYIQLKERIKEHK